jgi:hypothetical protein
VRSRGAESYIRLAKEIIAHYFVQAESSHAEVVGAQVESGQQVDEPSESVDVGAHVADDGPRESVAPAVEEAAVGEPPAIVESREGSGEEGGEASVDEMGKTA